MPQLGAVVCVHDAWLRRHC